MRGCATFSKIINAVEQTKKGLRGLSRRIKSKPRERSIDERSNRRVGTKAVFVVEGFEGDATTLMTKPETKTACRPNISISHQEMWMELTRPEMRIRDLALFHLLYPRGRCRKGTKSNRRSRNIRPKGHETKFRDEKGQSARPRSPSCRGKEAEVVANGNFCEVESWTRRKSNAVSKGKKTRKAREEEGR